MREFARAGRELVIGVAVDADDARPELARLAVLTIRRSVRQFEAPGRAAV
jgi:hypothetical protein